MAHILYVNGPNLNLLGKREPQIYGKDTLEDIEKALRQVIGKENTLSFMQSQYEGKLLETIHGAKEQGVDCIVINAGALTHTSIALRDALLACHIPFIELHLSNTHQREKFRHHSYLADKAQGIIMGFGAQGYELALMAALKIAQSQQQTQS